MWGYKAKALGKTYAKVNNPDFNAEFKEGLQCKLAQHREIANALLDTDLPLTHYYVYGLPPNHKVIDAFHTAWVIEWYDEWRNKCRQDIDAVQDNPDRDFVNVWTNGSNSK